MQCRKARRWSPGTYVSDDVALVARPLWEPTSGSEPKAVERIYRRKISAGRGFSTTDWS